MISGSPTILITGAGVVDHFAGVLFKPRPGRFLPTTNTVWFSNLVDACLGAGVGRIVLISFPRVEGPTSRDAPATGRLDREPVSVYGRGILMIEAAALNRDARGNYHVGDDQPVRRQHLLDEACRVWGLPGPRRMPVGAILAAAWCCEVFGSLAGTASPLTRDFIRIGRVSYYGDTRRARKELIPTLRYPTLLSGLGTL